MKKSNLFSTLAIALIVSSALLSGCGKTTPTCTTTEDSALGGYKGTHSILGNAYTFDDSLTITNPIADDQKISIKSERLGTTLTGTLDANNCGRIILDSVIIASQSIETVTLTNIRAAGSGTINGNIITTVINIKSGSALVGSLPVPLNGQSLTGTFTK